MNVGKLLFIARHAKSSWKDSELRDSARPLNKRGERDAPLMGKRVAGQARRPEHVVSSSAVRALSTAEVLARCLGVDAGLVEVEKRIYEASAADLMALIREFDDGRDKVMLVGHNPGLTNLLNLLTGAGIDNMPTCAIATVALNEPSWSGARPGGGKLVAFDYPKR